ncbi:transferase [Pseudonocardia broussonetiae]|uniref:Transferase n=1 Tax=Pseudonocardia broussonetiae TaxID=2736640 RepID=A0A6M6JRB0_9PSEU|nr:transferase [Pseudonocardia broussonetiae]
MIRCRSCAAPSGHLVLDLGEQPACEYFPPLEDPGPEPVFPLRLWLCAACGLAQLPDDAALPDEPVGAEPAALARQRADAIAAVRERGLLPAGATVTEGATPHGGSWLPELAALGVHPAADGEPADLVVDATFGLMHEPDQRAALARLVDALAPDGVLLFGFHSLAAILAGEQWNAVRLGHYAYYSAPAAVGMLARAGLTVTDALWFPLYGGTVLLVARRGGRPDASVAALVASETAAGVLDAGVVGGLQDAVARSTDALRVLVHACRDADAPGFGYSAASRAVALVHLAGLRRADLPAVADASPAKQGRRMPGTDIPIVAPERLLAARPRTVLLFVSDLLPEVRRALPEVEASGGRWVDCGAGPAQ